MDVVYLREAESEHTRNHLQLRPWKAPTKVVALAGSRTAAAGVIQRPVLVRMSCRELRASDTVDGHWQGLTSTPRRLTHQR